MNPQEESVFFEDDGISGPDGCPGRFSSGWPDRLRVHFSNKINVYFHPVLVYSDWIFYFCSRSNKTTVLIPEFSRFLLFLLVNSPRNTDNTLRGDAHSPRRAFCRSSLRSDRNFSLFVVSGNLISLMDYLFRIKPVFILTAFRPEVCNMLFPRCFRRSGNVFFPTFGMFFPTSGMFRAALFPNICNVFSENPNVCNNSQLPE